MSVRIMSKIFELSDVGPTQRLILLALADHADDNGRCYPSIARLCERTGLKERSVQSNIKALVASGLLRIDRNAGPKGCNVFHVTPAGNAPPQEMHPASNAPTPRISCTPPPQEMHPNHHRTIKEPSEIPPVSPPPSKSRLPEDWVPDDDCWAYAETKLGLTANEIQEIADDFRVYWTEGDGARTRRTQRGWKQAWRNRCLDIAPKYRRNRQVAGHAYPQRRGQGSGLAGAVARRQFSGGT